MHFVNTNKKNKKNLERKKLKMSKFGDENYLAGYRDYVFGKPQHHDYGKYLEGYLFAKQEREECSKLFESVPQKHDSIKSKKALEMIDAGETFYDIAHKLNIKFPYVLNLAKYHNREDAIKRHHLYVKNLRRDKQRWELEKQKLQTV